MNRLFSALAERFTDPAEIHDIARNGAGGGVSGFIYYHETRSFFFAYENEIQEYISDLGYNLRDFVTTETETVNCLINRLVWATIEAWCQQQADATLPNV